MKYRWPLLFILCLTTSTFTCAQQRVVAHPCTRSGKQYNCDKTSFEKILRLAKTISVQTPRLDPASTEQLNKLARSLGKTVRSSDADLTFTLSHPDSAGIYYGPSDRELATLRVYYGAADEGPGELVWVESYSGQPDTPWPIAVNHLAEQFRARFQR